MKTLGSGHYPRLSSIGLINLFIVYILWSTTYLAIRIMVRPDSGFTIVTAGALRMLAAGLILLGFALIKGYRIKLSWREWVVLIVSGILFWAAGNGLIMYAEQSADSGFTALVLACAPILVAFLDSLAGRQFPPLLLIAALLLSFAGQAFLVGPSLWQGNTTQLSAGLILILSCLCSATGSVITKRFPVNLPGAVMSAYQHLGAGVVFLLVMLIRQVPLPHPSMQAGLALAYLVVFGSVVGFTAFITAIRLLPINIALTHAYVNPVLAMFLGWLLLNEPVTGCTLAGAAMVILGVVCVFRIAPAGEKTKVKAMNRE